MLLVNTSIGRFSSDSVDSERKFHSGQEGRLVPILNLKGGHVRARSEHVYVVAHEGEKKKKKFFFFLCIFCSVDATGRITALCRSEFLLT